MAQDRKQRARRKGTEMRAQHTRVEIRVGCNGSGIKPGAVRKTERVESRERANFSEQKNMR
jgi:hypothetical protein